MPDPMPATWPTVAVEIAFDADPFDPASPAPTWTPITDRVLDIAYTRGRQYELAAVEAGTAELTVRNDDGALDPANPASPYAPNVKSYRPIRVRATWAGTTYDLFTGYVERWPQRFGPGGKQQWTDLVAVDALAILAVNELPSAYAAEVKADRPRWYYPLGEPVGTPAPLDASGNGAPATISVPKRTPSASGTFGAASVQPVYPDHTSLALTAGAALAASYTTSIFEPGYSLEWWLTTSAHPAASTPLLTVWQPGSPPIAWYGVTIETTGKLIGHATDIIGTDNTTATSPTAVNDGTPHHVVLTVDNGSGTATLYVDGVALGPAGGFSVAGTRLVQFGARINPATRAGTTAIASHIGHAAAYPTVLTADRVAAHYTAGATGFAGEDTGARIDRLLDYARWTAGRSIAVGDSTVRALDDLAGQTATDAMQAVAATENGLLRIDGSGAVVFANRHARYDSSPPTSSARAAFPTSTSRPAST